MYLSVFLSFILKVFCFLLKKNLILSRNTMKIRFILYIPLLFCFKIIDAKEGPKGESKPYILVSKQDKEESQSANKFASKTANKSVKKGISAPPKKKTEKEAGKEAGKEANIQDTIENTFHQFLNLLKSHPPHSKEYKKVSSFIEKTLYNEVSFDSLKVLAELYLQKEDKQSYLRLVKAISVSYPDTAESFYLLGNAHKALLKTVESAEEQELHRKKMLESYSKVFELNPKHAPTYEAFLSELMDFDEEIQEAKHTRESLNLVMDMLKYLKEKKHYILLCEAYYDNKFIRQTKKACVKSIRHNPNDPISLMTLAFSLSNKKKKDDKLTEIASKYSNSFKTQYKIGLYFKDEFPDKASVYLIKASQIQPDHLRLNEILARLLLKNNQEEMAYPYFLKACLLGEGVFLSEFKTALGVLHRRKKIDIAAKFDKGVTECFQNLKERKKNSKKENKKQSSL